MNQVFIEKIMDIYFFLHCLLLETQSNININACNQDGQKVASSTHYDRYFRIPRKYFSYVSGRHMHAELPLTSHIQRINALVYSWSNPFSIQSCTFQCLYPWAYYDCFFCMYQSFLFEEN